MSTYIKLYFQNAFIQIVLNQQMCFYKYYSRNTSHFLPNPFTRETLDHKTSVQLSIIHYMSQNYRFCFYAQKHLDMK